MPDTPADSAPPKVPHPALELHPVEVWGWPTKCFEGCPTCRTDGPCQTRQLLLKGDSDA